MKRSRALAAVVALALLGAACAGSSDDDDDAVDAGATTAPATTAPVTAAPATTEPAGTTAPASSAPATTAAAEITGGPGVDLESGTIRVGVLLPTTGPLAFSVPYGAGIETYFARRNAEDPLGGRFQVEVVLEDSQYNPEVALTEYEGMKGDVALFGLVHGTPIVNALLSKLEEDGIVAVPTTFDLPWLRSAQLVPLSTPFQIQQANALAYAVEELGAADATVCSLVQADTLGEANQEGVDFAVEHLGLPFGVAVEFAANTEDFVPQVQQLEDAGCGVVGFGGGPTALNGAGTAAVQLGYEPQWLASQAVTSPAVSKGPLAEYWTEHLVAAGNGATWDDTGQPGQAELLDAVAAYAPDTNPDGQFAGGFTAGRVTAVLLERAIANGDLSREGIAAAAVEEGVIEMEGLSADPRTGDPADREPPRTSTIFVVDASKPTGYASVVVGYESETARAVPLP